MKGSISETIKKFTPEHIILIYRHLYKFISRIAGRFTIFRMEVIRRSRFIYYPKPVIIKPLAITWKKVVYTIILGGYDDLKEPEVLSDGWDYVCFTDRDDLHSEIWEIIKVKCPSRINLKRCSSFFIIFPFKYLKQYELSILVGGQISIHCDLNEFVRDHLPPERSIAISRHPERNCIYDEALKVMDIKKDSAKMVMKQMNKYRREGFPPHFGLIQSGVMIRRHDDEKLKEHCRLWLKEVQKHSQRDQLSFNYILWKYKLINPEFLPPEVLKSSFRIHRHNYRQQFHQMVGD